jgi:hypothetical protein
MRWTDWFWTILGLAGLSTLAWSLYWPVAKTKMSRWHGVLRGLLSQASGSRDT